MHFGGVRRRRGEDLEHTLPNKRMNNPCRCRRSRPVVFTIDIHQQQGSDLEVRTKLHDDFIRCINNEEKPDFHHEINNQSNENPREVQRGQHTTE